MEEGYSSLTKIFRLDAYKRAWSHCGSVTLEGKQHLVVFLHSRAASLRALRLYAAYRQSRHLAWRADQINLSTKRNNGRKLYRERQYPIPRLKESQRGVRILSKRKRGMLLGERFVKTVPLQYKFKPIAPRDADTANALCLEVCYVPAVCELPVSRCEREFVPSDCDIKINTIHKGWCSFLWRRKRDSNPRGFGPNGFQDRLVVTASIFLHIIMHAVAL